MNSSNIELSIIIPAKNEAVSLVSLLPELKGLYPLAEIITVNDGSTDGTSEICRKFGVREIKHNYSMGNGAAVKSGARAANGDMIVFMDGDGQHRAADIALLLEKYREGYDMVVGCRNRASQASVLRFVANKIYNALASWMVGQDVKDLTSGFRIVNAERFQEFLYLLPNGFSYPTTSTMAFFRAGYSICYQKVSVKQREGKSHIRLFRDGAKFVLIIFKVGTLYSPLKLFSVIGGALFSSGLAYYLFTYFSAGRFTNMGMLLLLSSVIVFLVGLLSEQVSTLFYKK